MDGAVSRLKRAYYTSADLRALKGRGVSPDEMKAWDWVCPRCNQKLGLAYGGQRVYFRSPDQTGHECEATSIGEGESVKHRFDPCRVAAEPIIDLSALAPSHRMLAGSTEANADPTEQGTAERGPASRPRTRYTHNGMPETLGQFASLLVQLDREGIGYGQRRVKGLYGKGPVALSDVLVTPNLRREQITNMPRVASREEVFIYGVVADAWVKNDALCIQLRPAGGKQTLTTVKLGIPLEFSERVRPNRSLLVRGIRTGGQGDHLWFGTRYTTNVALGKLEALDGHLVMSEDEMIIDDFFTCKGIPHTVPSRHEETWNLDRCRNTFWGWIPDWILHLPYGQQVIVEYFGFAQTGQFGTRYAATKAKKLEAYPTLAPKFAFLRLEQATHSRPELRKRQLHAALDNALAPILSDK